MKATRRFVGNVVRTILTLALIVEIAPSGVAAQSAKAKSGGGAPALLKARPAKPSRGPQEGIKVHGHWVIEVRNPDGSLVKRHEFNNALNNQGQHALVRVLAKQATIQEWFVRLDGSPSPCLNPVQQPLACTIAEPNSGFVLTFKTLNVNFVPDPGGGTFGAGALTLAGNATVAQTSGINVVETQVRTTDGIQSFTGTTLATPINVVANQIVQVTVTIRFSS